MHSTMSCPVVGLGGLAYDQKLKQSVTTLLPLLGRPTQSCTLATSSRLVCGTLGDGDLSAC